MTKSTFDIASYCLYLFTFSALLELHGALLPMPQLRGVHASLPQLAEAAAEADSEADALPLPRAGLRIAALPRAPRLPPPMD